MKERCDSMSITATELENNLGKYLHVTTGVGSMDTPMRWGTDSELVVLKLRKNQGV